MNLDLSDYHLWDFAGINGLQVAKELCGEEANRIAPWRSLELSFHGQPLSLLRLCEGNFRIGVQGNPLSLTEKMQAAIHKQKVWWKPCDRMTSLAIPEAIGLEILPQVATPKPPHRLVGLQENCAAPCRIEGIAVVVWRHFLMGISAFELQTAIKDGEAIRASLKKKSY